MMMASKAGSHNISLSSIFLLVLKIQAYEYSNNRFQDCLDRESAEDFYIRIVGLCMSRSGFEGG